MKPIILSTIMLFIAFASYSQSYDSIKVPINHRDYIILQMTTKNDIDSLTQYDVNKLIQDLSDTYKSFGKFMPAPPNFYRIQRKSIPDTTKRYIVERMPDTEKLNSKVSRWSTTGIRKSFNLDFGMNNYLNAGSFLPNASLYTIKHLGSWSVRAYVTLRSRLAKKFFLEYGGGLLWYNFKFQNNNTQITRSGDDLNLRIDPRDLNFKKSKLTAVYLDVFMIPVIDLSNRSSKGSMLDGGSNNGFRFGVGPFVSYRVDSYSKIMYKDGKRHREHDHDNFNLNNIQYGLRTQFGFRNQVDVFFSYTFNNLFVANNSPSLNAYSFGVTF